MCERVHNVQEAGARRACRALPRSGRLVELTIDQGARKRERVEPTTAPPAPPLAAADAANAHSALSLLSLLSLLTCVPRGKALALELPDRRGQRAEHRQADPPPRLHCIVCCFGGGGWSGGGYGVCVRHARARASRAALARLCYRGGARVALEGPWSPMPGGATRGRPCASSADRGKGDSFAPQACARASSSSFSATRPPSSLSLSKNAPRGTRAASATP